ncbi:hypothetical protein [Aequorivita marina]|uniref:hypothetical protein n=1 Tax=Aequorivita marina TaxID=3073654 RepID=UPI002876C805|nr:hypothetical protein [Aequorivita sp. S2608]MDS1297836.1 hypothetical protein [Aequorivita sp. S2608]
MKKLVLFSALIFGMVFYSCSSDDDSPAEDNVNLVGEWQLTNVDFTRMEEGGIPASDACIVELVAGYDFRADGTFYFILGDTDAPISFEGEYWSWDGELEDFRIIQDNPASPPYNFSLTPTNINVTEVDGKTQITFNSEMSNGSAAKFTIVKEAIDTTQLPELTDPDGTPYHCGFFD